MLIEEMVLHVEKAIKTLRYKFLESPFAFYTESAMHCYLYHLLHHGSILKKESKVKVGGVETARTILLHNEYPTLGKFYKRPSDRVLIPDERDYVVVRNKRLKPTRGIYDLAIIEPDSTKDFKCQKTSIAIELALNEVDPSLLHFQNDYTKITYQKDQVDRGYILFFVRKQELSFNAFRLLPELRQKVRLYGENHDPRVRILYLEAPRTEADSEIQIPPDWFQNLE